MTEAIKRLQQKLGIAPEAVLVTDELNLYYFTGFHYTDGFLLITPDEAVIYTDSRYTEAARKQVDPEIKIALTDADGIAGLRHLLLGAGIRSLGYEDRSMTCHELAEWQKRLPDTCFVPVNELILNLREFKSPKEREEIIAAQRIAEQALSEVLGIISTDMTEQELAFELDMRMRRLGASGNSFETIAVSGQASSLPHGVPRPVKIQRGFLTMDFGAIKNGYCSDMTRTVCIGQPDDEMRRVYQTVADAQNAAIEAMHKGALCRDADAAARRIIADAGYGEYFGHGLGHGVGLYIHESPRLSPAAPADKRLECGHVVTAEPGIYLPGRFGVRIEDMVFVEENGIRDITLAPKELIVL